MAKKILVVDDEVRWRCEMRAGLSGRGYEVFCSNNVVQTMEIVTSNSIDLTLVDGLDGAGAELVTWLKENSFG